MCSMQMLIVSCYKPNKTNLIIFFRRKRFFDKITLVGYSKKLLEHIRERHCGIYHDSWIMDLKFSVPMMRRESVLWQKLI